MKNKVSSIISRLTALALCSAPFCSTQVQAQEVYSQIVGAIAIDVPAESDVVVAFPFKRSASFRGPAASATANTITINGEVFSGMDFGEVDGVSNYYVFIESDDANAGNLAGRRYDIASNTNNILTLKTGDDVLTGFGGDAGAPITVRQHWTLDEAFPSGVGFVTVEQPAYPEVLLIVPEQSTVGGGFDSNGIFYYSPEGWRQVGNGAAIDADVGGTIIPPGSSFVIQNNTDETLRSYFFGEVVDAPLAIPVVGNGSEDVDNFVSLERPLGLTLDELIGGDSGLGLEDVLGNGDHLLVYGMGEGYNKVPTAYEYTGTQWQVVDTTTDAGDTEIKAGEGIAIRRASGSDSSFWVNQWDLPQ